MINIIKKNKLILFIIGIFIFSILFLNYKITNADTGYSVCDYTNTGTPENYAPGFYCNNFNDISGSKDLYGIRIDVTTISYSGVPLYFNAGDYGVGIIQSCTALPTTVTSTGLQDIMFSSPVTFASGTTPYINIYSNNTCTSNSMFAVNGSSPDGGFTTVVFYWSDPYLEGVFPNLPSGTVTSPVTFNGTYTNNSTYNQIQIQIFNLTNPQNFPLQEINLNLINGVNIPYSSSIPLFESEYEYQARLFDSTNNSFTDWTTLESFTVDNNYGGSIGTPTIGGEILECDGITDIGCHLQNVITRTINAISNSFSFLGNLLESLWTPEFFRNFFPLNLLLELSDLFTTELPNTDDHILLQVEVFETTVNFVDTQGGENFMGSSASYIRTIIGYSFWMLFFWMLWGTANSLFNNLTSNKHE